MSRCSSSPGFSFSYRRIGSGGANWLNHPRPTRLSHLATVERGQPVQPEISAPLNLRSRKDTILLSCFCDVLLGIRCGLEDRSLRPARPSARYLASHRFAERSLRPRASAAFLTDHPSPPSCRFVHQQIDGRVPDGPLLLLNNVVSYHSEGGGLRTAVAIAFPVDCVSGGPEFESHLRHQLRAGAGSYLGKG